MRITIYLICISFTFGVNAQEFKDISITIPIDIPFTPTVFKSPIVNFGTERPKGNFTLTAVGIPKENTLPKMVDMRSSIYKENTTTKREYDMSRLTTSFKTKATTTKSSVYFQASPSYSPYSGLRENQRGVRNISYKDSRMPIYVSPYQRRSLWDY